MCKIHKQDEFNSNQRITSDAMLHKGFEGFDYDQPRSQGFHMRTRRDTRKPWSGPVNFAF